MSFLRRVAGRSLRDRVRSSVTREELGVEPLLLHVERSQLRWLGHRMPPGRLPREAFRACPTGKRPRERPRTHWRDYVSRLAWERLGILPEELEVSGDKDKAEEDGWMDLHIKRRPSEALPELLRPVMPITSYELLQPQDSCSALASLESGLGHLDVDDWDF